MEKQITFKQYRVIDLILFSLLTAAFEAVATFATDKWFVGQPMAISITLALILITMHRWGGFAAIIALVGGAAFCFASGADARHYLIYCGGNLFALASMIFFKFFGKSGVKENFFKTLGFSALAYVSVAVGRWLLSLPFGAVFSDLVGFLVSDLLSLLFAVIILWCFREINGLVEDQKSYLLRLDREKKEKNAEYND